MYEWFWYLGSYNALIPYAHVHANLHAINIHII